MYNDTTEADRLATELAAGRGPDLYIGTGTEFKDFYKVLNTGVFCDLTQYQESRESFDRLNYVDSAHVRILTVLNMVFNDMEPYFKDEQSYEACLQKLQSDLTIYISE